METFLPSNNTRLYTGTFFLFRHHTSESLIYPFNVARPGVCVHIQMGFSIQLAQMHTNTENSIFSLCCVNAVLLLQFSELYSILQCSYSPLSLITFPFSVFAPPPFHLLLLLHPRFTFYLVCKLKKKTFSNIIKP